jgi:hypothetical protein
LSAQSTAASDTPVLWVLQGSHYAERVLWAAQLAGWPVRLRVFAPGPHVWALRRAAPQLRATHLPVLMQAQAGPSNAGLVGTVQGSDAILDHMGWPTLQGAEGALQQALVQTMGPLVRRVFYAALCHQPQLARGWASAAYAPAPATLRAVAQRWPTAVLRTLLWRESARAAQLPSWLQSLPVMADAHQATAQAILRVINECQHQVGTTPLCTGPHRLALTAGALLGPLLLPLPAPWQAPPWSPDLQAQVQALQQLPLWRLAHAAWALRTAHGLQTPTGDS